MQKRGPFSVLLCDDSLPMRTALRGLMDIDSRFEVVGEASDGVEAVQRAEELRPDLILLDITMPRMSGIEALPGVVEGSPHSTVVLLTALSREVIEASTIMHMDALRGVYYMDKTRDGEELLDSIAELASASLATSVSPEAAHRDEKSHETTGERIRRFFKAMSTRRRLALVGFAVLILSAVASLMAIGAESASGSCVHARQPWRSGGTIFGRATHDCSGSSKKMYAFVQGRYGRGSRVYTVASGSTTGTYIKIGARRCPYSGRWHTWTLATRGLKTDTSSVISYSCKTSSPTIRRPTS
jgi:DNA-binding NarL/FixJ family response regulator